MPSAYPTPPLPDSCATQVEAIVEAFEAAWHRGERPRIDSHLPPAEDLRRAVLVELVHADLEWRLKAGEDARAESAIGVPARGPNSQIQAMLTARKPGWHGEGLQTATVDAPVPHKQTSGGIQRP